MTPKKIIPIDTKWGDVCELHPSECKVVLSFDHLITTRMEKVQI